MNMTAAAGTETPDHVELSVRLAQQELVAAFGMFALRCLRIEDVLDQACQIAARGLNTRFAKVLRFRADSQDFLLTHGVGWAPGIVGTAVLGADLASPAGFAFRTKLPVVSNHLSDEQRFRTPALLVDNGIHRAINVIIGDETESPHGVLEADSTDRLQFTTHDVAFLQSLANVVAAAIKRHDHNRIQAEMLRDKDLLMQEVHHRIKNSLQLVQTLLYLQARSLPSQAEADRLNEAAGRIASIAAVHRQLHQAGVIECVSLPRYLDGLLDEIADSLVSPNEDRPISVEADALSLPAEHVTPIGLIAVELVTNALKYGAGPIAVTVREAPGGVDIGVRDAGPGFPAGFDAACSRSLGMRLVNALARTPAAVNVSGGPGWTVVTARVTFSEPVARA